MHVTTNLKYNIIEVKNMENKGSHFLRELTRTLVRSLGVLEKSEVSCCGITVSQCHAIVEIGRKQGITLNELAELLSLDKSTMSRTINNLVEAGHVERELHPEDRRFITLQLTQGGLKIFEEIEGGMEAYFSNIFASIPQEKRSIVIESLELLIDAVKDNKCC